MSIVKALEGGLAGAVTLTLVHQAIKQISPDAPRMDLLGMNAISKLLHKTDTEEPPKDTLYGVTMAGDIISNTLYYSLTAMGGKRKSLLKGALLGLGAGLGAVLLPKPLGLNESYSNRTRQTQIMTVALYLIGGLVSAATYNVINEK